MNASMYNTVVLDESNTKLPERKLEHGPIAWCTRCSRKHHRRDCDLVPVERTLKSGNKRIHLVHSSLLPKEPKAKKRTKARKS